MKLPKRMSKVLHIHLGPPFENKEQHITSWRSSELRHVYVVTAKFVYKTTITAYQAEQLDLTKKPSLRKTKFLILPVQPAVFEGASYPEPSIITCYQVMSYDDFISETL